MAVGLICTVPDAYSMQIPYVSPALEVRPGWANLQPVAILSALPLSLGGSFVMLLLTRSDLEVPSMVRLVMLLGIVTKNAILLVEYTIRNLQLLQIPLVEALVDACSKRARAIVMTTVAMTVGMLAIALGFCSDASFRQPMVFAVIGGLLTSTVLSLLVVHLVYSYVEGFRRRVARSPAFLSAGSREKVHLGCVSGQFGGISLKDHLS